VRIFLYEFMTAGGCLGLQQDLGSHASWYREGLAMLRAVAADFLSLADCQVLLMRDHRIPAERFPTDSRAVATPDDELRLLRTLAATADYSLLIGPEMGSLLLDRVRICEAAGAKLLSPRSPFVAVASHKGDTADRLREAGVPVPPAVEWSSSRPFPLDFPYPAVLKPLDGVGSEDTFLIDGPEVSSQPFRSRPTWRLERFCPGMPASIAAIAGASSVVWLPACEQSISSDGRFAYRGGRVLSDERLHERARRLAGPALSAMPPANGFVGIDLILGRAISGQDDFVIEVNPRLTTSYVGLRKWLATNLAEAMLSMVQGRSVELLSGSREVEFDANGEVSCR
jgi:predicted ATP-grasp superfamily ATP-dependent carboligase